MKLWPIGILILLAELCSAAIVQVQVENKSSSILKAVAQSKQKTTKKPTTPKIEEDPICEENTVYDIGHPCCLYKPDPIECDENSVYREDHPCYLPQPLPTRKPPIIPQMPTETSPGCDLSVDPDCLNTPTDGNGSGAEGEPDADTQTETPPCTDPDYGPEPEECDENAVYRKEHPCYIAPGTSPFLPQPPPKGGNKDDNFKTSCIDAYDGADKVCVVKPKGHAPFRVFCARDLYRNRPAWTVILHRFGGNEKFDRSLNDYINGFGNPGAEYWLGLKLIHFLTTSKRYELLIRLKGDNCHLEFQYDKFIVGGSEENYMFRTLGRRTVGTNDINFRKHLGMRFSAKDRDYTQDKCAGRMKAGWWFYEQNWYFNHTCGNIVPTSFYEGNVLTKLSFPSSLQCKVKKVIMAIREFDGGAGSSKNSSSSADFIQGHLSAHVHQNQHVHNSPNSANSQSVNFNFG